MSLVKFIMHQIYRMPFRELGTLSLAGTAIFVLFYCITRKRCWQRPALVVLSFAYALLIVCGTLLGREESAVSHGVSLIPFVSYIKYARGQTEMLRESIMNIVFFYPLGLLFGVLTSAKKERRKAIIAAFLLSVTVETCQGCFNLGYAEVDDVIHNTLGAGLGVLVIYVTEKTVSFVNFKHKRPL